MEMDPRPFRIITPTDPNQRGAQLSLLFDVDARPFFNKLRESDIVCDFREPNVVRVAPAPLYNSFSDVIRFAKALRATT
jgi:kynureninase